jgi:hypothetical protein
LRVIAEGIESSGQLDLVQTLECEYGQGFLFSKAVDSRQAEKLLLEGFSPGEGIHSPETASVYNSPAPEPARLAEAGQTPRFMPSRKHLIMGLPVCILLIFLSLVAKFNYLGSQQSHPPSLPVRTAVLEPAMPDVLSTAAEESPQTNDPIVVSAATRSQSPAAVPSIVRKKAAVPVESAYSAPVIHDHALGGCKGILRFTRHEISFASSKDKDSFVFASSQCSYALDRDRLTIKAGPKVFRFKSATAQNKAENQSQLRHYRTSPDFIAK